MKYTEIEQLVALQKKYGLSVASKGTVKDRMILVDFAADGKSWPLYIEDEYNDFDSEKQLLCIFLTLRALEDFQESSDFTDWCKQSFLDASNPDWLTYYKELGYRHTEIEETIGPIDSFINSLDYQLRSGAFSALVDISS